MTSSTNVSSNVGLRSLHTVFVRTAPSAGLFLKEALLLLVLNMCFRHAAAPLVAETSAGGFAGSRRPAMCGGTFLDPSATPTYGSEVPIRSAFFKPRARAIVTVRRPTGEMRSASSTARRTRGVCPFARCTLTDFGNTTVSRNACTTALETAALSPGIEFRLSLGMPGAAFTATLYVTVGSSVSVTCTPPTTGSSRIRCASVTFAVPATDKSVMPIFTGLMPP